MYFVACCMSSQSDRNYFKTILIIVKFREVWKKKKEEKEKHAVSSLIRHPGPTPGTVLFSVRVLERIQHRRTPAFAKSGAFQMVITCSLKLQPNHHPLTEGTCFLWQPLKLLCWESILFDQSSSFPSLFTHHFDTAHPNTGSTGRKRGRKKLIV